MSVLVLGRETEQDHGLRPLDVLRDLDGVGKLIDIAFAEDIAIDGSQFLQDLTFLSLTSPAMWALRRISAEMRDSFDGFVWVEDGRIVGNVTLSRDAPQRRVWTVTSVAVHPNYRRRGIARALMLACLAAIAERGGGSVTLQVSRANKAAYDLYLDLGFHFVDGMVTARRRGAAAIPLPLAGQARRVAPGDGQKIYELVKSARALLPDHISPLRAADYQQTALRRLADRLGDLWFQEQRFWLAVEDGDRFLAAARVHLRSHGSNTIDLTIAEDGRGHVEEALIQSALAAGNPGDRTVTVHVGSHEETAQAILWRNSFNEVRCLHRLVVEIEEDTS